MDFLVELIVTVFVTYLFLMFGLGILWCILSLLTWLGGLVEGKEGKEDNNADGKL